MRPTRLFIDIDKFKSVNSSFGLVVGDSLLLTVARRLQRHLGPQDTLARVGGDQFAMLLLAEHDPRELAVLAERVRRSLRAPIKIAGQEIVLTGSIGIAVYDGADDEPADLLQARPRSPCTAPSARGADRIEIFNAEMRAERDERVALESDLRKALEKKQLSVVYQPIIYLPTEELAGFEALVRWEHPKLGMLNPADFIPVAEESDLIVKLGSYVLLRAVREARALAEGAAARRSGRCSCRVNISSRQLFRPDLVQEMRHILGRAVVPKGSLRLEITESLVMENPEQATEVLRVAARRRRRAGARRFRHRLFVARLSQPLPVRHHQDRPRARAGERRERRAARPSCARSWRWRTSSARRSSPRASRPQEDVGFLRSIGCEYAQGFYYGEPMSERDVLQLLKMVRTAERKLRPRGLFRTKTKGKQRDKGACRRGESRTARRLRAQPHAEHARPPGPPATLPNSTVRPRPRPAQPQAAGMAQLLAQPGPPPPPHHMHASSPDDFAMPPPPPPMPADARAAPVHAFERARVFDAAARLRAAAAAVRRAGASCVPRRAVAASIRGAAG